MDASASSSSGGGSGGSSGGSGSGGSSGSGSSSGGSSSSSGGNDASGSSSGVSDGSVPDSFGADSGVTELPDITLPGTPAGPGALAVDDSSATAYVAVRLPADDAGQNVGGVAVVNVATGAITTTIQVPGIVLSSIAVDPSSHKVFAAGFDGVNQYEVVTVIDGTTNTITGSIAAVPVQFENYLAVDPSTHHVFGYDGSSKVSVLDGAAGSVITHVTLTGYGPATGAGGLAVDPASHTVWALGPASSTGSLLTVIDGTMNTAGTSTPYTGAPAYLADDAQSTGNLFVVTQSPQTVVLDGPINYQVPSEFTVDAIQESACKQLAFAYAHTAMGSAALIQFWPDGSVASVTFPSWSSQSQAAALVLSGKYEVVLVEQVVNGSPTLLPVLKYAKDC